jgi:hypothetical protein
MIATTAITAAMARALAVTSRQSSPFAPAHPTSAVTGGKNIAPMPAAAASTTAPHSDALTPARFFQRSPLVQSGRVPRREDRHINDSVIASTDRSYYIARA